MSNIGFFILGLGFFLATVTLAVFMVFASFIFSAKATGSYSYEYRCTNNVVEKRLHVWWGVPIFGFQPIDGDPVGACIESFKEDN